ncbi:RNA polymerase sigma factor [Modestobacter sp. SSW1-42]|uniref:RNA polymerase sigma factor n=1 Tax=Modestobacter sp. SSW1-42 TaxID=596372 RepID=UPI003985E6FB
MTSPPGADDHFAEVYRTVGTAVLGYVLRRCATREDALDVVAETFATAWRRRGDLPADPAEARPWLFGIARHCLANSLRSAGRTGRLGTRLAASFVPDTVPDPAVVHEQSVATQRMRDALAQLSPEDRELVTLIAWEGLTPAGAAAALGLTTGAARTRLYRARTRLRTVLATTAHTEETDHAH